MAAARSRTAQRPAPTEPSRAARLPWAALVAWALAGTALCAALVAIDVSRAPDHPAAIIQPGDSGPSRDVFIVDFPDDPLPPGTGHDGQQFYAIARQPMHPDQVAPALGRPHYRLQRIGYPLTAWALHPQGGGRGLVMAFVLVGLVSLAAGGIAAGALANTLGGRVELAAVFPLLPGCWTAMRISTADTMALALAIAAVVLLLRGHGAWAVAAGVGAVLTRETSVLVLAGAAMWRRDRVSVLAVGIPAAFGGLWALWLRLVVTDHSMGVNELAAPGRGLLDSARHWLAGADGLAAVSVGAAVVLGVIALRRHGLRGPLGWVVLLQLALVSVLRLGVLGLDLNGPRATLPLLLFAVVAVTSPSRRAGSSDAAGLPAAHGRLSAG